MRHTCTATVLFFVAVLLSFRQGTAQTVVDWDKGDHNETRMGTMDGNLVSTIYYNFGEVGDYTNQPSTSGVWPKGTTHTYIDGVAVIVQAETQDPSGNTIHPLETNYYEYTRYDASTGVTYGWWPLPGYAKKTSTIPAQSNNTATWPSHWPDRPSSWDGDWNGFFGKGIFNADLESYFVFDDNEDRAYILKNGFYPDAADSTRGGLGMQVHARGFQWAQVLAEDVIFWYYEITNMGTKDYTHTLFAQYVDWGIGGHDNSSNNAGSYNKSYNISYAWSTVSKGSPGNWSPVGYAGYAFLESPGIADDKIDNDQDGLTDERRDNVASVYITDPAKDPYLADVATDTVLFKNFYNYSWKPHWDADENCNWRTFSDDNGNGKWDEGEALNDDVGSDGIGPLDSAYTGPDEDGTQGNGKPDQGEPNFGLLDKDESDQLGLTGFLIAAVHTYDLNNDERNWTALSALPEPPESQPSLVGVNLANFFSSYLFHMNGRTTYGEATGETERFSMALIFGSNLSDLLRRKKTVQSIYNSTYQFVKPPDKPTVKVVAGNKKVTLYWDSKSEKSWSAYYQKYNFEGYKIYRSTESNFLEDKTITDSYGNATYRVALATYDLVDGVSGLHPVSVNGAHYDLGEDSGLRHSYVDTSVVNGQTYYYAVVAYDQGYVDTSVTGSVEGIPPSETTCAITVDANGKVTTDINTAVVTPRAAAAGYVAASQNMVDSTGPATGSVAVTIIDPSLVNDNHRIRVDFFDTTAFHNDPAPSYMVRDLTAGDTLVTKTKLEVSEVVTNVVEGFAATITNDSLVQILDAKSGWETGSSNYTVALGFSSRYSASYSARRVLYPADYQITFTDSGKGQVSFPIVNNGPTPQSNVIIKNLTENIDSVQFMFRDSTGDGLFNDGDVIYIVSGDSAGKKATSYLKSKVCWSISLSADTTIAESKRIAPAAGDVYIIRTSKPFRTGEYYDFLMKAPSYDKQKAVLELQNIAVVPNPYVGAASWEPTTTYNGRGERRVYFIHLPAKCTIRIYTVSGRLVQTLYHDSTIDDGQEAWDLVTKDGMDLAYGVYIFHVDAGTLGSRIDRFAVIK